MIFSSLEFLLIFLPTCLIAFGVLAQHGRKAQILGLSIASLAFYGFWDVAYVPLLLLSIAFNYVAGSSLIRETAQGRLANANRILSFGILVNLSLLAYYKYSGFIFTSFSTPIFSAPASNYFIPLGISFYTFTQIAYLIDCWRGDSSKGTFSSYLLFVTFFPHLIAGPILHHKEMIPQFEQSKSGASIKYHDIAIGLTILAIGLAKKVLIADNLAPLVKPVFDAAEEGVSLTFFEAWFGTLSYSMQLYFDFSGYSDMAVGISRMFGIRIPINFTSPYKSTSISEFWKRWHITLSRFLKAYLYIPLGGNRKGSLATYRNLFVTMILGGLWHGAGWTFILWGTMHGLYLCLHKLWRVSSEKFLAGWNLPCVLGWSITFFLVTMAWVPFRAATVDVTLSIWSSMLGLKGVTLPASLAGSGLAKLLGQSFAFTGMFPNQLWAWSTSSLSLIALSLYIALFLPNTSQVVPASDRLDQLDHAPQSKLFRIGYWLRWRPTWTWSIAVSALLILSITQIGKPTEFLYFQF